MSARNVAIVCTDSLDSLRHDRSRRDVYQAQPLSGLAVEVARGNGDAVLRHGLRDREGR